MRSGKPTLLLDVMDTLVVDPFHDAIPAFFGLSLGELIAAVRPGAWVEFERGRLAPEEYATHMFADGRAVNWPAFEAHLRAAYRWIDGMEELASELARAGVRMHALSNYPVLYRVVDDELGLSRYVELRFVSCETGHRKPDPDSYLHAARELGLAPHECLFVDDRTENCRAAERVGMPAVRFESAALLRAELQRRGVL